MRDARDRLRVIAETTREALSQARSASEQSLKRQEQLHADRQITLTRLEETRLRQDALTAERARLSTLLETLPQTVLELTEALQTSSRTLTDAEKSRAELTETLNAKRLVAQSIMADRETTERRLTALVTEERRLSEALTSVKGNLPDEARLQALQQRVDQKRSERSTLDERCAVLTHDRQDARIALSQAEQETARTAKEAEQTRSALAQLATRAKSLDTQITSLEADLERLKAAHLGEEALGGFDLKAEALKTRRDQARLDSESTRTALTQCEQALAQAEAESRGIEQQRALLTRELDQALQAQSRQENQLASLAAQRKTLDQEMPDQALLTQAQQVRTETQDRVASFHEEIDALTTALNVAKRDHEEAEKAQRSATANVLGLRARQEALEATKPEDTLPSPLIDSLVIPADLERAVASALDDTLEASLDATQNRAWTALPDLEAQPLPQPCQALLSLIDCPPALRRCLGGIGLVTDAELGAALQPKLEPGQCLVTREGALWRWDGYREAANLPSNALNRVAHSSALRALEAEIAQAEAKLAPLAEQVAGLAQQEQAYGSQLTSLRDRLHQQETALVDLRNKEAALLDRHARVTGQCRHLEQSVEEATIQHDEAVKRADAARSALSALIEAATLTSRADTLRQSLSTARQAAQIAQDRARTAETEHGTAQEEATRLRLLEESNTAKTATLTDALERARQDRAELATQRESLEQGNHDRQLASCREAVATQKAALVSLESQLAETQRQLDAIGKEIGAASRELQAARDIKLSLTSRLSALVPQHEAVLKDLEQLRDHQTRLPEPLNLAPLEAELATALERVTALRVADLEARDRLRDAETARDRAGQEHDQLSQRQSENNALSHGLKEDLARLDERVAQGDAEILRNDAEKTRLEGVAGETGSSLGEAEEAFSQAATMQSDIESALDQLGKTRQQEEQRCHTARENAIRLQERLTQACAQLEKLTEARNGVMIEPAQDVPLTEQSETTLKRRLTRNQNEREALGPVNLLAEEEYTQARAQSDHLAREHEELTSAIDRLRGSISGLKKEGRERLQAVFVEVDRHFQALFSRMFNGGKAHLGLVGSDDPLEAGLEIFAQPPGKKLSTLSLLSGGEQALTALSLIFATFRCQPAPLCILDEVDAPLDDANVERLCGLLKEMAEESQTRFLIVTHHQLTMAHMDRLFGVTMQERGVSQILSVDLTLAASFAESGSLAVAP
ncbi:coiled-coil domain-containing protein [Asaia astilbis]|uniref:hypothetical protein n=1 Tax=Asaia astilbis TaxID=610244 RepID=UPI000687FF24|nr:hypothetical protein [Asaia astilbis]